MWVFTRDGFFSVVQHEDESGDDLLLVRARRREDLENMVEAIAVTDSIIDLEDMADMDVPEYLAGPDDIVTDKAADYHYRVAVPRVDFADYLAASVLTIDYTTSVKTELDQGDKVRHEAMMEVWTAMVGIQPEAPWVDTYRGPADRDRHDWGMGEPDWDAVNRVGLRLPFEDNDDDDTPQQSSGISLDSLRAVKEALEADDS